MTDIQTSEVDTKFAPVNVRPWSVKFGNHDNNAILVWQLNPYLGNHGSHSLTLCLTTVIMVSNVTMETNVHSLL
jgi:hypothetical protein